MKARKMLNISKTGLAEKGPDHKSLLTKTAIPAPNSTKSKINGSKLDAQR